MKVIVGVDLWRALVISDGSVFCLFCWMILKAGELWTKKLNQFLAACEDLLGCLISY